MQPWRWFAGCAAGSDDGAWRDELPRSPGHVFDDRLQRVLRDAGFDAFAEKLCQPFYATRMGAPSLPPGRYFRMHLVGYFEGIASERGLEWRCADSLSLRDFLGLGLDQRVPHHPAPAGPGRGRPCKRTNRCSRGCWSGWPSMA